MGVEYRHCAYVRGGYRPSAERVARFARALADEGWIASSQTLKAKKVSPSSLPRAARKTGAMLHLPGPLQEHAPFAPTAAWLRSKKPYVRISWPMVDVLELGGRFPVEPMPYFRESLHYDLELHWSRWYLDVEGDDEPGFSGRCVCGTVLERPKDHVLEPTTYLTKCPRCGVDPASFGSGQGLHRFALVVDCAKNIPEDLGEPWRLHRSLAELCTRSFHAAWSQVGVVC